MLGSVLGTDRYGKSIGLGMKSQDIEGQSAILDSVLESHCRELRTFSYRFLEYIGESDTQDRGQTIVRVECLKTFY